MKMAIVDDRQRFVTGIYSSRWSPVGAIPISLAASKQTLPTKVRIFNSSKRPIFRDYASREQIRGHRRWIQIDACSAIIYGFQERKFRTIQRLASSR